MTSNMMQNKYTKFVHQAEAALDQAMAYLSAQKDYQADDMHIKDAQKAVDAANRHRTVLVHAEAEEWFYVARRLHTRLSDDLRQRIGFNDLTDILLAINQQAD